MSSRSLRLDEVVVFSDVTDEAISYSCLDDDPECRVDARNLSRHDAAATYVIFLT